MKFSLPELLFTSVILNLIFLPGLTMAQGTFQRTYSVAQVTVLNGAVPLSGGGYLTFGHTGDSTGYYFLSRLNASGDVLWTKNLDIPVGINLGGIAGETINGGFYFLCLTDADTSTYSSLNLALLDTSGNVIHNRIFSGSSPGEIVSPAIRQKQTGEFYISSRYSTGTLGNLHFYIKADSTGNPEWQNSFCSSLFDKEYCYDLEIAYDDGLIGVGGNAYDFGLYIIKTDTAGSLDWVKKYADNIQDFNVATSIKKTTDGGYIVGGIHTAGSFGWSLPMLMKIDSAGNFLWAKYYGSTSQFHIPDYVSVVATDDGGYALNCMMLDASFTFNNPLLIKTDSWGNIQWAKRYALQSETDLSVFISRTTDNGFLLTTNEFITSALNCRGYLIKTDSLGHSGCNETSVTLGGTPMFFQTTSPVANVPQSGSITSLINTTPVPLTSAINCLTGQAESSNQNGINLYPNPATSTINVLLNGEGSIEILNVIGEILLKKGFSENSARYLELNISALQPGIYMIRAGDSVSKFVKE